MPNPTRRALIRTGIVGTAAAVAGAAALREPAVADADPLAGIHGDPAVLHRIVAIEQLIAFAYEHIIASVPLSAAAAGALRDFANQEHTHIDLLSKALTALGQTPPPAPTDATSVSRQLTALHGSGSLTSVSRESEALPYLVGIETVAEGVYYAAVSKLSDSGLVLQSAGILACEAQHWASLNELYRPGDVKRAVPYSTVHG